MSTIQNDRISDLVTARRLLITARELEARRQGKQVDRKTAKEIMAEDQALLSGEIPESKAAEKTAVSIPNQGMDETGVSLAELARRLREVQNAPAGDGELQPQAVAVEFKQTETVEFSLRYSQLERVDGLVVRSKNLAETDRYAFEFQDSITFRIVDKWSGRSTRIWGDPHVDTDDQEGDLNGEFSDLTGSDSHTTLMLQDGTQVTFTAKDRGVIERVDLFKDGQHLAGLGGGSQTYTDQTGLFADRVDTSVSTSSVQKGDTLYAGGDGNDWFDASRRLVWGQTTGPVVTARPSALLELTYRRTLTQSLTVAATFGAQA